MGPIARILALTDFSADADNALARAGRIAASHAAALRLVHIVSEPTIDVLQELSPRAGEDLQHALLVQAEQALADAAQALAAACSISVTWALRKGGVLAEALAAAAEADLVVLGARGTNPVRDFVLGTTPERLLARNASPTLVVRRSAVAPYRRALAAIAEPDTAPAFLAAAEAIAPAAEVHALHATDLPFEGRLRIAGVGEEELRGYRRRSGDRALAAIQHAIAGLPAARSQQVLPVVATGNAIEALIEHQRASGIDLIIIGKRADGGLGDFLLGSTARHVLAGAGCDVLVIALPAARAH